jgi:hypothetical protein
VFAAFGIGLMIAGTPRPTRGSGLLAALGFAGVIAAIQWLAGSVGLWFAARWVIPECAPGTVVVDDAGWYLAYAGPLLVILGINAGRAWRASGDDAAAVAAPLGVLGAPAIAVFFAWRALGLSGTMVAAGVVALVAATMIVGGIPARRKAEESPASWCAAIALGMCAGAIDPAFELAGGGTLVAALITLAIVLGGALLGGVLREVVRWESRWLVAAAGIALAASARQLGLVDVGIDRLIAESKQIAESSGGLFPHADLLAPAPYWLGASAIAAAFAGAFASPRMIGLVLVSAMCARIVPRHDGVLAVMTTAAAVVALGAVSEVFIRSSTERRRLTGTLLAAGLVVSGLVGAAVIVRDRAANRESERDGAVVGPRDANSDTVVGITIDGLSTPLRAPSPEVAERLIENCNALGDAPERCLVLGPGGAEWVAAALATTACEVDYVTPYRADAAFVRDRCAAASRARFFVMSPRRFLAACDARYDRIFVCPPEPPWHLAGVTRTREFRDRAVACLAADGIVAELFVLTTMQPANLVNRMLADAVSERVNGVLLVDHPLSRAPALAFTYGRVELRFDVDLLDCEAAGAEGARCASLRHRGARSVLSSIFADTSVLRFAFALQAVNRDDRPWLAASMHARVEPDDRYLVDNFARLLGCYSQVTSRIDGPRVERDAFIAALRRDHEAAYYWFLKRSTLDIRFVSDVAAGLRTPAEIALLEACAQRSPDAPFLRDAVEATVSMFERTGQRARARDLLERVLSIEQAFRHHAPEYAKRDGGHELEIAWIECLIRHLQREEALRAIDAFEGRNSGSPHAALLRARVLANSGRSDRARAEEIVARLRESPALDDELERQCDELVNPPRSTAVDRQESGIVTAVQRERAFPRRPLSR